MKPNQFKQYKIYLLAIILSVVLLFLISAIYADFKQQQEVSQLDDNLKLKAPKENIVQYTEYDQNGRPLQVPSNNPSNNVVQYIYRTDQVVPPMVYEGYQEDISQRTPSAQIFLKSVKQVGIDKVVKEYVGKFYSGINFDKVGDTWYQVESATTTKSAFLLQTETTNLDRIKRIAGQPALADTIYSGAGDGYVYYTDIDGDWQTAWDITHDATSGTADYTGVSGSIGSILDDEISGGRDQFTIQRVFLPFDTSSIPDESGIDSASLSVYVVSLTDQDNDGNDFLSVVQTTQASNTTLTAEDFDQCGAISSPTEGIATGERKDISSISTSAFLTFTLNSTGIGWISKTGYTNLGLREGHDVLDDPITDGNDWTNQVNIFSSEIGQSQSPYLTITFITMDIIKINGGTIKINGGTLKIN